MKKLAFFLTTLFVLQSVTSQVNFESFQSSKLGETRDLKILLPRGYNPEEKTEYPLVIVLDGDYLFEPVIGNIDYQSYWDDMPECVVVGVKQADTRTLDFSFSDEPFCLHMMVPVFLNLLEWNSFPTLRILTVFLILGL